ncbi:MAG: hypothetical protein COC01_02450, partial [Bacteroidetes bacterium]
MLRKSCLYLLLLLFSFGEGYGQDQHKIDSLTHLLQTTIQDTTKVSALIGLSGIYYLSYPDTALVFCEKALLIAEKANIKEALAECYGNLAFFAEQKGDISKALEYNFKSVEIFEELIKEKNLSENLDKKGLATVYNNIGRIYDDQGEIEKGLEYFFLSLKIREEIKDKVGIAGSYNNIGGVYDDQGEIEKVLEYYFLSLKIREEIKDKRGMAISYNNIGAVYYDQGEMEKVLEYYFLSLKIQEEIKDKLGMAGSYTNIGNVLCELDSLEEGMRYFALGLELNEELGNKAGMSYSNSSIGRRQLSSYAKASEDKKARLINTALKSGLEALTMAKEIGHVEYMKRALELLSEGYKKQAKFENAISMYELQIQMRDSILNEENTKATIRQQMKYDYEKEELLKEQEQKEQLRLAIEAQSRRDDLHYAGIFIGMFLLFG